MLSRAHWVGAYFVVLFAATTSVGVVVFGRLLEPLPADELRALRLVHQTIQEHFVEPRDPGALMVSAIEGMVSDLDVYSGYVPAEAVHDFVGTNLEGTYEGIGILIASGVSPMTVRSPLPGGPAERAGIQVGDRIVAVDGVDLSEVPADEIVERGIELLRGEAGSRVMLRVERDGGQPFHVELARADVPERKVRWAHLIDPERRIGYVWIEGFQTDVARHLGEDLEWLEAEAGGALGGLILDLRHDLGGKLEEGVAVTNRFLPAGEIVKLVGRGETVLERHVARPENCTMPDVPMVVLVDGQTASASEIVTGALQDHDRAVVVGVRTYGKGAVQSVFRWQNVDFRLKLTTAFYYTPSGRCIDRSKHGEGEGGILPDVVVELPPEQLRQVIGGLHSNEIPRRYREAARALAARLGLAPIEPPSVEGDAQLAAALDVLRDGVENTPGNGDGTPR